MLDHWKEMIWKLTCLLGSSPWRGRKRIMPEAWQETTSSKARNPWGFLRDLSPFFQMAIQLHVKWYWQCPLPSPSQHPLLSLQRFYYRPELIIRSPFSFSPASQLTHSSCSLRFKLTPFSLLPFILPPRSPVDHCWSILIVSLRARCCAITWMKSETMDTRRPNLVPHRFHRNLPGPILITFLFVKIKEKKMKTREFLH